MSSNFLQSLDLDSRDQRIFRDGSLIVTHQGEQVDGSFVLHFLTYEISRLVTKKTPVDHRLQETKALLILNLQSTDHWISIASKLGWSMTLLKDQKQLAVIDLVEETYKILAHGEEQDENTTDSDSAVFDSTTGTLRLDRLLKRCTAEVDKLFPSEVPGDFDPGDDKPMKLFIILEDLTGLLNCTNESDRSSLDFLRQLRFLRQDLDICLVTLVSSTNSNSHGKYFSNLICQSLSTLTFNVNQLRTGFSAEVNGVLTVEEHDRSVKDHIRPKRPPRNYHYKLLDRGIKFSPL